MGDKVRQLQDVLDACHRKGKEMAVNCAKTARHVIQLQTKVESEGKRAGERERAGGREKWP